VLGAWSRRGSAAYRRHPRPESTAPVTVAGPDPLRVLVFGTDAASGWGVLRQDLALPGHLARALRAETGRGVHVALVDCGVAAVTDLVAAADALPVAAYDAAVVIGGITDAVHLEDATRWREALDAVLRTVRARSGAHVFLTGIPRPSTLPAFRLPEGGAADRAADALDRASADLCGSLPGTTFVPSLSQPAPVTRDERLVSSDSYAALAAHLAAAMTPHLGSTPPDAAAPTTP
jgi:putative intracellular protease/amidase